MGQVSRVAALMVVGLLAISLVVGSGTEGVGGEVWPGLSGAAAVNQAPAQPSPGCGSSTAGPVTEERRDVVVSGSDRWFLLTVPPGHDGVTPVPLVLDFHGYSMGAALHTLVSEFSSVAAAEGFAVAFPEGQFSPVHFDVFTAPPANEDLEFFDVMVETLGAELCLDLARIYATGYSAGGFFTSFLACHRADRLAAVATVAGVVFPTPCPLDRNLPVLSVHGTEDPLLLFNATFNLIDDTVEYTPPPAGPPDINGPGFPDAMASWAATNGCGSFTDIPISDEVLRRVYACPDGLDVEFLIVIGGGHSWPGSAFSEATASVVGYTTFDIHASVEAWEFFSRFALPCEVTETCVGPSPTTTTTSASPGASVDPPAPAAAPAVAAPVAPTFTG